MTDQIDIRQTLEWKADLRKALAKGKENKKAEQLAYMIDRAVKGFTDKGIKRELIDRGMWRGQTAGLQDVIDEARAQCGFADPDGDSLKSGGIAADQQLILTSAEFVKDFIPPDYLLDGVLLCGFVYALTALTGHGKTAVALSLSAAVGAKQPEAQFAGREVTKGRVLYFAGENPDDVRMRWIGMAEKLGFDPDTINVSFIPGVYDIKLIESRIHQELEDTGGVVLIIIDTSPAYFTGDSENDNQEMIAHAQMLYRLRLLPGKPTVLAACHPVKNAARDNLIPRGGGGFLNAIDGNMTAWRSEDGIVTIGTQGKFRGPEFDPIMFELIGVTAAKLKDSKGRQIPTVVAMALSKEAEAVKHAKAHSDGDEILMLLYDRREGSGMSGTDIAKALRWMWKDAPAKSRVQKAINGLNPERGAAGALVESGRGGYGLTKKGLKVSDTLAGRGQQADPEKPRF